MKDPEATLAIKVIAPSVFLVALSTVYKGFFQGSVNMIPTAISQVTESLIRLFVGFAASYLLLTLRAESYTLSLFFFGALWNAIPGIVLQLLLIPVIVMALRRAKV